MPTRNRRPVRFDHVTGRHEYSAIQARELAEDADRHHAATIARHAAAEGVSVAEYEARDPFAIFGERCGNCGEIHEVPARGNV